MRWVWVGLVGLLGCGIVDGSGDEADLPRLVKRASQAKFEPDDFTFAQVMSKSEDGKGGLFGTCLHVSMRDEFSRMAVCQIGVILPIHIYDETWPRDASDAAKMSASAANATRKHLAAFKHADEFTCGAYRKKMQSYLGQPRPKKKARWKGARVFPCNSYKNSSLPDFYFKRGVLLIGNYRQWSMREREK